MSVAGYGRFFWDVGVAGPYGVVGVGDADWVGFIWYDGRPMLFGVLW